MTDAPTELDDLRALVQRQAKEIEELRDQNVNLVQLNDRLASRNGHYPATSIPTPDHNEGHV